MTPEDLIAEGRLLQRPCKFLRDKGSGPIAAIWHEFDPKEVRRTGYQLWITVDVSQIPGTPVKKGPYMSIFTNERSCVGGKVTFSSSWDPESGTPLYASNAKVLPPLDAVFSLGSDEVAKWLEKNCWPRNECVNSNFKDQTTVQEYENLWMEEHPLYHSKSDVYAMLGGWHWPGPDDDWHDLIDQQLLVFTLKNSEPWVEAWQIDNGQSKVIQRIT